VKSQHGYGILYKPAQNFRIKKAGAISGGKESDSSGTLKMAERRGFEPRIPVKVWPLSRRLVSTTHAPLRARHSLVAQT
jgi:hypothetical protein